MTYAIILAIVATLCAYTVPLIKDKLVARRKSPDKNPIYDDSDLVKTLLSLDEESLDELLLLYKKEFGAGAWRYARRTVKKWRAGSVRPSWQTFDRFLIRLPKVMNYDLKCEVLRRLMEEYCSRNDYEISVFTDDWEATLEPLVRQIVDKPYTAELPKFLAEKLRWLSDGETQIAQNILKKSQIEEGRIAVSMLRREIANIETLLAETKGESRVSHRLKFPYGTITLEIKRR